MSDEQDRLRISNADRDEAIERLQRALDEGRIELSEFDERAGAVYEAKTYAELEIQFSDLPKDRAEDKAVHTIELTDEERAEREAAIRRRIHGHGGWHGGWHGGLPALRALVVVGGITTAIWLASSIASGEWRYFWPIWPILGLSIAVAVQWMGRRR